MEQFAQYWWAPAVAGVVLLLAVAHHQGAELSQQEIDRGEENMERLREWAQ